MLQTCPEGCNVKQFTVTIVLNNIVQIISYVNFEFRGLLMRYNKEQKI